MLKRIMMLLTLSLSPFTLMAQDLGGIVSGLTGSLTGGGAVPTDEKAPDAAAADTTQLAATDTKKTTTTKKKKKKKADDSAMNGLLQGVLSIGAGIATKEISKKTNEKKKAAKETELSGLKSKNAELRAKCQNEATVKANAAIDDVYKGDSDQPAAAGEGIMGSLGALVQGVVSDESELDYDAMIKKYKDQNAIFSSDKCNKPTTTGFSTLFGSSSLSTPKITMPTITTPSTTPPTTGTTQAPASSTASGIFGGLFGK